MKPLNMSVGSQLEQWRAETALTKEPGTVRWIEAQVQPGDVFYDIGANVGIYTMMAAQLVGDEGHVYAFEPHVVNARSLVKNLSLNVDGPRVSVITSALHDQTGFFPFNYRKVGAGSSGHQLGHTMGELGDEFVPQVTEIKHSVTVEWLVRKKIIRPATLIKLDVDGNELLILKGMEGWLPTAPLRSIQVEVHPKDDVQICQFMQRYDFRLVERHYTHFGQEAIDSGIAPEKVAHNAVFIKV